VNGARDRAALRAECERALAHWRLAAHRLGDFASIAPVSAWQGLEHYLGVSLRQTVQGMIANLEDQGAGLERRLHRALTDAELHRAWESVLDFRRAYTRAETAVDFYADALATRASPRLGALLRACDHIATRGMAVVLAPLGRQVPSALTYLDAGLGASVLKAGLRLWDGRSENPVATIKVVRHNLLRPTAVLHEAGHQVAYMLGWNEEVAAMFRAELAPASVELAELFASWSSEITADLFAFAHTGYASVLALHDVIDGSDSTVFQFLPGDPHPISDLRLMMTIAFCRATYGAGPWDELALGWRARHPLAHAPAAIRRWIEAALPLLPRLATRLLTGRCRAFNGHALAAVIDPARVSPAALDRLERAAGGAAFSSSYWIWDHAIPLLALTGYRAGGGADALRQSTTQQERWMLTLGALRSAA